MLPHNPNWSLIVPHGLQAPGYDARAAGSPSRSADAVESESPPKHEALGETGARKATVLKRCLGR
jgi:hypothetical protein